MSDIDRLNHLQKYLVEEYVEDYQEGQISRRKALKHIAAVMGSLAAANAFLAACAPVAQPPAATATGSGAAPTPAAAVSPAATRATAAATAAAATSAPTRAATGTTTAPATSTATAAATRATATRAVLTTTATAAVASTAAPAGVGVPENDPAISAGDVTFPGPGGATLLGYQAHPSAAGRNPIVLVCHENRGLTDHIKDVTRRLGKAGYAALAVDLLSRAGGTSKLAGDAISGALGNNTQDQMAGDFRSGLTYMKTQSFADPASAGMTGFCFGGGITWLCATQIAELKAAVPWYGPNPPLELVPNTRAAVLALYGGEDTRINAGIDAIEAAMKQNNKTFEKQIFPGAKHAFNNDTGANYNAEAARAGWQKMLGWFEKYL